MHLFSRSFPHYQTIKYPLKISHSRSNKYFVLNRRIIKLESVIISKGMPSFCSLLIYIKRKQQVSIKKRANEQSASECSYLINLI